jgi:sec-independent protein translocase protein TatA
MFSLSLMTVWAFLPTFGTNELIVISLLSLLFFGHRLPSVMRSLGKGVTEFKKGINDVEDDVNKAVEGPKTAEAPKPGSTATSSPVERY